MPQSLAVSHARSRAPCALRRAAARVVAARPRRTARPSAATAARDVLRGTRGSRPHLRARRHDRLFGGRGRDRLYGGRGATRPCSSATARGRGRAPRGGRGNDTIRCADGAPRPRVVRPRPRQRGARRVATGSWTPPRASPNGRCETCPPARPPPRCVPGRRRRHRRLQPGRGDHGGAARRSARHGRRARRHRVPRRHAGRVRPLLRADLGPAQGAHPAGRRQPRVRHPRRRRLLRLLRRRRRRARQGLVQLRPRRLARGGAQHQLHAGRRLPGRLRSRSAGCAPTWRQTRRACTLAYMHHPRFSSGNAHGGSPAVDAAVARARGRRRGAGPGRPRPRLRALRAPDADGALDPSAACASSWSARAARPLRSFGTPAAEQRGARQHTPAACCTCGCARRLRLAVRGPARQLRSPTPAPAPATDGPRRVR